jgi:hypothetical protein
VQSSRISACLTLALLATTACGPAPTALDAELPYVLATNSCAPTDAAAVTVVFSSTALPQAQLTPPLLSLSIWTGIGSIAGRTFRFLANSEDGYASFSTTDVARDGAVTGKLRVHGIANDSSIIGTMDVRLADGTRVERDFTAPWRPTRTRCG